MAATHKYFNEIYHLGEVVVSLPLHEVAHFVHNPLTDVLVFEPRFEEDLIIDQGGTE